MPPPQPGMAPPAAPASQRILSDEDDRHYARAEEEMRAKLKTARGTRPAEERETATALSREKMQQKIQMHSKMALEELKKGRSNIAQPRGLAPLSAASGTRTLRGSGAGEGSHHPSQRSSRQQSQQDPATSATPEHTVARQTSKRMSPIPQKPPLIDPDEVGPAPAVPTAPVGRVQFSTAVESGGGPSGQGDTASASGRGVRADVDADGTASSTNDDTLTLTLGNANNKAAEPKTAQPRSGRPTFMRQKSHSKHKRSSGIGDDADIDDENDDEINPLRDPFASSAGRAALKSSLLLATNRKSPPKQPKLERAAPGLVPAHSNAHDEQMRQRKLLLIQKHGEELGRLTIVNKQQTGSDDLRSPTSKQQQQQHVVESQIQLTTALKTVPTKPSTTTSAPPSSISAKPTAATTVTASMMPPPPTVAAAATTTPSTEKAVNKTPATNSRRGSLATAVLARHLSQLDLSAIERITSSIDDSLMPSSARKSKHHQSDASTMSGAYVPPYISSLGSAFLGRRDSASSIGSGMGGSGGGLRRSQSQEILSKTASVTTGENDLLAPVLAAPLMSAMCPDGSTVNGAALSQATSLEHAAVVGGGAQPVLIPAACVRSVTLREDFSRDLVELMGSRSVRSRRDSRSSGAPAQLVLASDGGEKTYRCALIDLLWLEICSWRHGLKISEQEQFLLEGRQEAKVFFEEFASKQTLVTSRDCTCGIGAGAAGEATAYYNSSIQEMDEDYLHCLTQTYMRVQEILLRVSQAEQLYPNMKQFEADIPLAVRPDVQSRLQALYMWRNMYYEMSIHLDSMADIVGISRRRIQMFPKLSRTLQRSQALAMLSRGLSMNTTGSSSDLSSGNDSGRANSVDDDSYVDNAKPCRFHHFSKYQQYQQTAAGGGHQRPPQQQTSVSTEDSGVAVSGGGADFTAASQSNVSLGSSMDSNLALSLSRRLQHHSSTKPPAAATSSSVLSPAHAAMSIGSDVTPSMSFTNTNTRSAGFAEMAAPRSAEHANLIMILRHYLIRNLRGGATHIIEQFSKRLTRMLNARLDELRNTAPNGTTYRTILKRMRLPSLEPVLFFLVRFPMHILEEVMLIRQSQRPSSILDYSSLTQLKAETKEVLSLGSTARRVFVEQASKLASADNRNDTTKKDMIELALERYDDIFHATINLYLDYLMDAVMSAYRSSQGFGTQQKAMLEDEWKFVWSKLDDLDESSYMLPKAFCEISSQIFVLMSEFVKLGMGDFQSDLKKACDESGAENGADGTNVALLADSNDSINRNTTDDDADDDDEDEEEDDENDDDEVSENGNSGSDDEEDDEEEAVKDPALIELQRKRDAFRVFIRRCKLLCKQSTDRSHGALKFAKLLRKDLEVSAVYERTQSLTLDKLMDSLAATGHQRIEFKASAASAAASETAVTAASNLTSADDSSLSIRKVSQFTDDMALGNNKFASSTSNNTGTIGGGSSVASLIDSESGAAMVKSDVAAAVAADFSHTMFFVPQNIAQNVELVKLLMNTPIGTTLFDGLDNGYLLVVPINETRIPNAPRNNASRERKRKQQHTDSEPAANSNEITSEEEEMGDEVEELRGPQLQYRNSSTNTAQNALSSKRSTVFTGSGKDAANTVTKNDADVTERNRSKFEHNANSNSNPTASSSVDAAESRSLRTSFVRSLSSEAAAPSTEPVAADDAESNADSIAGDESAASSMVKTRFQRRRSSQMSIESMRLAGRGGVAARLAQQVEWRGENIVLSESVDSASFGVLRNSIHVREREIMLIVLRNSELFFKRRDFERALLGHLAQLAVRSSNSNTGLHHTGSSANVSVADAPMILCKRLQSPCYTRLFAVLQEVKTHAVELGQTLLAAFQDIERETLRIDELGMGLVYGSIGDATTGGHMSLEQLRTHSHRDSQSSTSSVPLTPLTPSGSTATTLHSSARTLLVYLYDRLMEHTRELARLFSKGESAAISVFLVDVARAWANFVLARCPEGRLGIRPRWAHTGFEFLQLAMQPVHTCHVNDEDFDTLQDLIRVCVNHVVGDVPVSDDENESVEEAKYAMGYGSKLPVLPPQHAALFSAAQPKSLSWATQATPYDASSSPVPPPTPALPDSVPSELHEAEAERMVQAAKNKSAARDATIGGTAAVEASMAAPVGAHLPPGMSMAAAASLHSTAAHDSPAAAGATAMPSQQRVDTKATPKRYWSNIDDYLTGSGGGMFQLVDDEADEAELAEVSPAVIVAGAAQFSSSASRAPPQQQNQTLPSQRSASPDAGIAAAAGNSIDLSRSLNVTTSGTGGLTMPLLRYRLGCSKTDRRRDDRLQREKRIGRISAGRVDTTKHLRSRRVNFRWQRGELLGQGKFGKVYQAVNLDEGRTIAVKLFQDTSGPQAKQFVELMKAIDREMVTLEGLNHENIIKYYGVEVHRDEVCIFMEFCGGGDLAVASRQGLPLRLVRIYTAQILRGIQYLHDNKILHLDMKGENVLLTGDGDLIKICDFNTAIKLRTSMTMTADVPEIPVGTPAFMAPEMINRTSTPGRAADIWSIGCCVVQMLTGKPPFYDMQNSFQVMYAIGQGRSPKIPEQTPRDGKEFLAATFIAMPQRRPMASDLLHYKFVAGV